MKRMKILIALLLISLAVACQTKPENTFTTLVTFTVAPSFPAGFYMNGIFYPTMPTGGTADWNTLLNKPLTFAPSVHNHDLLYKAITYVPSWTEITGKPNLFSGKYTDLTDLPGSIELQAALSSLPGILPVRMTTAQINALTPVEGLEVYDLTLHVKKYWNGTIWKVIACVN